MKRTVIKTFWSAEDYEKCKKLEKEIETMKSEISQIDDEIDRLKEEKRRKWAEITRLAEKKDDCYWILGV